MNRAIRFKIGEDIQDGPLLCVDCGPWTTPKWAWPGLRDAISTICDPHNFWINWAVCFKFGTQMEDGSFLRNETQNDP